ncbi:hypothetical protein BT93_K2103 [Corymbia citriodora subsp. variegata]|nr:hypothetical protein BT93_K2103 [Corymbia citriodora subsp. variegata]KAF8008324.1 hypothetical protein BT93_K2103 [Corymbia citriodora subsp. variegata]
MGALWLTKLNASTSMMLEMLTAASKYVICLRQLLCPILKALTFSKGVAVASKNDDWISDPLPPCFTLSLQETVICCFQGVIRNC